MTKKLQFLIILGTICGAIIGGSFAVFKWIDKQQDTDTTVIKWMSQQDSVHVETESFHQEVMNGIEDIKLLADSALIIGRENQQAIFANRYTIIQQIQKDTSLTRDEAFELLQPFLDGIKDLKNNNGWTPYVHEQ